jgi:hypothetical protein
MLVDRRAAGHITGAPGGHRNFEQLALRSKNKWEPAVEKANQMLEAAG